MNSPRSTVRSIPRRAWTATPLLPNVLVRAFVSMMGFIGFDSNRFIGSSDHRVIPALVPLSGSLEPMDRSPDDPILPLVVIVVLLDLFLGDVFEGDLLAGLQAREDLDPLERRDA